MPDLVDVFGLLALLTLSVGLGLVGAFGVLSVTLYSMNRTPAPRTLEEHALRGGEIVDQVAA